MQNDSMIKAENHAKEKEAFEKQFNDQVNANKAAAEKRAAVKAAKATKAEYEVAVKESKKKVKYEDDFGALVNPNQIDIDYFFSKESGYSYDWDEVESIN